MIIYGISDIPWETALCKEMRVLCFENAVKKSLGLTCDECISYLYSRYMNERSIHYE